MTRAVETTSHPNWSPAKGRAFREAINRIRKRSGSTRLPEAYLAEEILRLRAAGWTYHLMEWYAQNMPELDAPKTERRYRQAIFNTRAKFRGKVTGEDLEPDVQAMCQWTFDAFKAFFLRYSPYDYLPKHVEPWIKAFLTQRRLMLNVPPGHAKSEFFMIWVPIWLICRDRNVQLLLVSNAREDAGNWATEIAGQLAGNEPLIQDFGRFEPESVGEQKWKPMSGTFSVIGRTRKMKGAQYTVESRGMGSRVLGRRADFIIIDDPTRQEDAESPATRDSQLRHLRQQVFTRAEPQGEWKGGRIMVIGQRVHIRDLYGVLESQEWEIGDKAGTKSWHVEKYPAVLDWENKKTLWPERWNWQEIEQAYTDVGGHSAFLTMYQQDPVPEGTALIRSAWLEACKDRDRPARQGPRTEGEFLPVVRVLSMDPSPSQYNGFIVGDLLSNREQFYFYVTEVHRLKAGVREAQALVDQIIETARPDYFIFESSAVTKWLRDDPWFVSLNQRIKTIIHKTGVNKNTQEFGVQSLAGDFEFGRLSLPYGDEVGRRMTDLLGHEALVYPDGDTDDLLMALWFVKFNYNKLSPVRHLPTQVRGAGPAIGWSWLRQIKDGKNPQDEVYQHWQRAKKAKREKELTGVA